MTKAEEFWLKFTEEWRAEQDVVAAAEKKGAEEAESEAEGKKQTVVSNADNATLMPRSAARALIGCVEEVNGEEAREVTGFIPTRHELIQIVKFWYEEVLYLHQKREQFPSWGSSEYRTMAFGLKRIGRAKTALGEEAVHKAMQDVSVGYSG